MTNYEDFLPEYPDINEPMFQQKILNKKEFYDLILSRKMENIFKGDLLNHQKIIQRFLSHNTLYDELLLYHETGTGKTGVAFGLTEHLYNSNFTKVYVLAKGSSLLVSLMKSLVSSYSARYSVPTEIEKKDRNRYIKKLVSDFYQFRTFDTFTKEISRFSDEIVKQKFNNSVFIVDEVHNIKSDESARIYTQFHRLFHLLDNRKILLMSGTPMRDDVNEIAYIMNLILPLDKQLPIGDNFNEMYVAPNAIINQTQLKTYLKGRTSFLLTSPIGTKSTYMGNYSGDMEIEQFKLFKTRMNEPQLSVYKECFRKDTQEEKSVYSNSRQALLFVFPDKTTGVKGFEKNTSKSGNLKANVISQLNTLEKLQQYSSKYSFIIDNILKNPRKLVYIYCSIVNGSGINLLCQILNIYGFSRSKGDENIKARRYISLTSETTNIDKLLSFFNSKRNRFGDYCQVIIGSRKISEGFTFKNIQIIHVTTLHWNYTEMQQSVARGIRYRSHSHLIEDGIYPNVQIYQHASVYPKGSTKTVDILMMETSQQKDIPIRKMNRIIKEISFDCPLVFERNKRDTGDFSRDCDYQECVYECDEIKESVVKNLDLNTYNLYYETSDENLLNSIKTYFKSHFTVSLQTLQDILEIDMFRLLRILSKIINYNIPLENDKGVSCFLREENNIFYLVDNIIIQNGNQHMSLYCRTPFITKSSTLKEITNSKAFSHTLSLIQSIQSFKDEKNIRSNLFGLTTEIQELFIEYALRNKYISKTKSLLIDVIENIYKKFLKSNRNYHVISVFNPAQTRGLSLKTSKWEDCILEPTETELKEVKVDIENNPYGYYGIVEDDRFCIKDIRSAILQPGKLDKRKIKTGANCLEVGFNKPKLVEICIHLGIEIPNEKLINNPRKEFIKTKYGRDSLDKWNEWSDDDLARAFYWYSQSKKDICSELKKWFGTHGLLIRGPCGKTGKLK